MSTAIPARAVPDTAQLEQMVVNLALEAKELLGRNGTLRIVTRIEAGAPQVAGGATERAVCVEVQALRSREIRVEGAKREAENLWRWLGTSAFAPTRLARRQPEKHAARIR